MNYNGKSLADYVIEKVKGADRVVVNKVVNLVLTNPSAASIAQLREILDAVEKVEFAANLLSGAIEEKDVPKNVREEVLALEETFPAPSFSGKVGEILSELTKREKVKLTSEMRKEKGCSPMEALIKAGKKLGLIDSDKEKSLSKLS